MIQRDNALTLKPARDNPTQRYGVSNKFIFPLLSVDNQRPSAEKRSNLKISK